jgi:competence protein ComEC
MRSGPAWLALGVIAAAGSASYAPLAGNSAAAVALAVILAVALAVAALLLLARGRRRTGSSLAVAALGAALVAARLSVGLASGTGVAGPGTGPTIAQLPAGNGPWRATVEAAHVTGSLQIATVTIAAPPVRCSAQLPTWPRLMAGDVITWSGRVRALGDGEYDRYLAGQGIAATCEAAAMTLASHDESLAGRLEALRQTSGDGLQKVLPEPGGGLAAAILIGLRDRVDRDLAAAFTTAGVSHIVAISGWNIAIVAASISALLRGFVGRRRRTMVTLAAIVAYTVFAGASASVVRAAFMAVVAMLALESGRGSRVMVSLAWAVTIMLLADPAVAADVGFQLSATATAGLVAWGTPLAERLDARLPWLPAGIRETLGVSLAAQAATLPIVLATFGRLSLVAPAANLVAVPMVPAVMAGGAVAFVAGWLALAGAPVLLAGLLAVPAHLLLVLLILVVDVAAAVPGASATLPFPLNVAAALAALLLVIRLHRTLAGRAGTVAEQSRMPKPKAPAARSPLDNRRLRIALAGAAFVVVATGSVVAAVPDGAVHVIVLNVGQGDAILLEGDRGSRILVDGGPDPTALLAELDRYVAAWDRRLDAIVLTHPHEDHVAGLVAVVQRYRVGRAFESGRTATTPGYMAWKSALAAGHVPLERLATGERLALDDATLNVLWPDDGRARPAGLDPGATDNRVTNDSSIVLLGEYQGRRFLLTGDAEEDVDPVLLSRGLPRVDMLKVAHHGSATATSGALLDAIEPAVTAVSVGADNTFGHPNAGTMTRLRTHSRAVDRTDQQGTIEVTLDRAGVNATTRRPSGVAAVTRDGLAAALATVGLRPPGGTRAPAMPGRASEARTMAGSGLATLAPAPGPSRRSAAAAATTLRRPGAASLLYDSIDVRSQPSRQRRSPALARPAGVASSPLSRRGRCRGMAGTAGFGGRGAPRSPPRRIGGPSP